MKKFKELNINSDILKAIEDAKYNEPTEIQEKVIPLVLEGKDVIAGSATGSGKTLAFGTGIIQNTTKGKGIQNLVLTPTRELAEQIAQELKKFSKYKPLNVVCVYGGLSINPQIHALRTADVVIGTPGRTLDHLSRRTMNLSKVKTLVLDEADRMLDMGFIDDVRQIIGECGKNRQTMLFSATIPKDIKDLACNYMTNPVKISAETYVDPKKLAQVYYNVPSKMKFAFLVHLLKNGNAGLSMIFCNSKMNVDFVANNLRKLNIDAIAMHGGFSQQKRNDALNKIMRGRAGVLVCTDVAARGLDIKGVSHVFNYDIPNESKQYVHRIGRTARAGKDGMAVNILCERDHENFSRVLRDNDVSIAKEEMPEVQRVQINWVPESHRNPRSSRGNFNRGPRRSYRR
jgi:ATP-dependent RNA helicase DeaD